MVERFDSDTLDENDSNAGNEFCDVDDSARSEMLKKDKSINHVNMQTISVEEPHYDKRLKVYYTICIYATFFGLGAVYAQLGPSLMDIQMINNVDLETGSWVPTSMFLGLVVGTVGNGFIFHRVKIVSVFFILTIVLFLAIASIPWSNIFGVTVLLYVVVGFVHGVMQAAGYAEVVLQWRTNSRVMVIILTLTYYVGSIISPLFTAPFLYNDGLSQLEVTDLTLKNSSNMSSDNYIYNFDIPEGNISSTRNGRNAYMLYVPFSITASMILFAVVNLAVYMICNKCHRSKMSDYKQNKCINSKQVTNNKTSLHDDKRLLTRGIKIGGIISLVAIMATANTVANVYVSYMSTFCVEYLHWTKQNGSYISALFFVFIVIGALVGIPLSKFLAKPMHLGVQTATMLISFLILLVSVKTGSTIGIWVTSGLYGFGYSAINSLAFSWMDDTFANMKGKLSSLFFLTATGVTAVNMQLTAFLMDRFSQIYFCYVLLVETSIIPVFCLIVTYLTFLHKRNCSQPNLVKSNK